MMISPEGPFSETGRRADDEALHDYFVEAAESGELDIYQIVAVNGSPYYRFRAWLCIVIQLAVTPVVILDAYNKADKGFCAKHRSFAGKFVGGLLCIYLNCIFWRFYFSVDSPDQAPMRTFDEQTGANS